MALPTITRPLPAGLNQNLKRCAILERDEIDDRGEVTSFTMCLDLSGCHGVPDNFRQFVRQGKWTIKEIDISEITDPEHRNGILAVAAENETVALGRQAIAERDEFKAKYDALLAEKESKKGTKKDEQP